MSELKDKVFVLKTTFGWDAEILSVDPNLYKYGQGINVRRIEDGVLFSIHPLQFSESILKEKLEEKDKEIADLKEDARSLNYLLERRNRVVTSLEEENKANNKKFKEREIEITQLKERVRELEILLNESLRLLNQVDKEKIMDCEEVEKTIANIKNLLNPPK